MESYGDPANPNRVRVQAIAPAMQMHLYEASQTNALSRNIGLQQLETCMTVLKEFRKTYWAADFSIRIFSEALLKMRNKRRRADHDRAGGDDQSAADSTDRTTSEAFNEQFYEPHNTLELAPGEPEHHLPGANDRLWSDPDLDFFTFPAQDPLDQ